jgi:LysR family cys regulon transcriptional activator
MEFDQLRAFQQIVKRGNYSSASKDLFLTEAAVSIKMRKLEKELGVKLFERFANTMKLTKEGALLSDAVNKCLGDVDYLKKLSKDISGSKTGALTIAATNGIMIHILPEIITKFKKEFPEITIKFIGRGLAQELLTLVSNDEVDLAIGPKLNQINFRNLKFEYWKSFGMVLVAPKDHPLQKKKTINLNDISRLPLILYRPGAVLRRVVEDALARRKLSWDVIMEIDLEENARKYVDMGIGVTFSASFMVDPSDKQRFWFVDVTHLFGRIDCGIYYRKNKYITKAMQQFIKMFTS